MDSPLQLHLSFKDEDAKQALAILDEVGATNVEEVPQRGLTGIEFVALAILATQALANLIIKLLPLWKSGVIVDARGPRVLTKKDSKLPQGTVLIIDKKGIQAKLDRPSVFQIDSFLKKIFSTSS